MAKRKYRFAGCDGESDFTGFVSAHSYAEAHELVEKRFARRAGDLGETQLWVEEAAADTSSATAEPKSEA